VIDYENLRAFLEPQFREYGGNVEIGEGVWGVFGVSAQDGEKNAIARTLLDGASLTYDCGLSSDDQWMLYYVDTANRPKALHWLDDMRARIAGDVLGPPPEQMALLHELPASAGPHRIAHKLVEEHARDGISAGAIKASPLVRSLLDRLHAREPLFFSAFHLLLANHLIDMVELRRQLIPEDIDLKNELLKSSLSSDPFLQSRQDAATGIHNVLVRFHIVNPLDQQKNTAPVNPYAAYMEVFQNGDQIMANIDGHSVAVAQDMLIGTVKLIRRNLYSGGPISECNTQAPWVTPDIAHPLRFIRGRLEARKELSPLDGLYMLERSVVA